jgi:hypothetical protein
MVSSSEVHMASISDPYTNEDYQAINDRLRTLNDAQAALAKATEAGINCADYPDICSEMIKRFTAIKQTYFPDRP